MDIIDLLPWIIFGAITVGAWAMMMVFSGKKNRADERLEELRDPTIRTRNQNLADGGDNNANGVGSMFKKAAPTLSKALQPKQNWNRII